MATTLPSLPPALSPRLTEREAIADAVFRAQMSIDTADLPMFESAFTSTATLYFNDLPSWSGIDKLKAVFYEPVSKLDTQHTFGNVRVCIDGETEARLTGTGTAMHFRAQEGTQIGSEHFLTGTRHHVVLKKEEGLWKIHEWRIRVAWKQGDEGIIWGKPAKKDGEA